MDEVPQDAGFHGGFRPVARIAGYRLAEQIGQGGMAVVYRAWDERLQRQAALKILSPALAADESFRHRFIRESRAAAAVDHPNIIPVFEAGEAGLSVSRADILAIGDGDGSTYLYNRSTGDAETTLPDPDSGREGVGAVAFSPNGMTLAAGDTNGTTYLWRTG